MKKVIIIGGGISGLSLAHYLQGSYEITLLEKSDRLGGKIHSEVVNGFLFEYGPRGFRPCGHGLQTIALAEALGLKPLAASPSSKKRYLAIQGRMQPITPWFLASNGLFKGIFKDLFVRPRHCDDETIESFWIRHFGSCFTKTFVDPVTRGIFGGDYKKLSARSCLPKLWEIDQTKGSLILGRTRGAKKKGGLFSFVDGMESLVKALSQTSMTYHLNAHVQTITEGHVQVNGQKLQADAIVLTTPASSLEHYFNIKDPHHYVTLSLVNLGWNKDVLKKHGYGFLVPSTENEQLMGMTFDSSIFPSQVGKTRLTAMIAGEKKSDDLIAIALKAANCFCGIKHSPDVIKVTTAKNAITQYGIGHYKWLEYVNEQLPKGIYAMGSGFRGVGVNDCVADAKRLADALKQL